MKVNVILICLALALLAVAALCVGAMHGTSHELMAMAQEAASALPDDPETAAQRLEEFAARWERTEPRWQFIASHSDLEKVSDELLDARSALDAGDLAAAHLACERIPASIESILGKELPTLGNIF